MGPNRLRCRRRRLDTVSQVSKPGETFNLRIGELRAIQSDLDHKYRPNPQNSCRTSFPRRSFIQDKDPTIIFEADFARPADILRN